MIATLEETKLPSSSDNNNNDNNNNDAYEQYQKGRAMPQSERNYSLCSNELLISLVATSSTSTLSLSAHPTELKSPRPPPPNPNHNNNYYYNNSVDSIADTKNGFPPVLLSSENEKMDTPNNNNRRPPVTTWSASLTSPPPTPTPPHNTNINNYINDNNNNNNNNNVYRQSSTRNTVRIAHKPIPFKLNPVGSPTGLLEGVDSSPCREGESGTSSVHSSGKRKPPQQLPPTPHTPPPAPPSRRPLDPSPFLSGRSPLSEDGRGLYSNLSSSSSANNNNNNNNNNAYIYPSFFDRVNSSSDQNNNNNTNEENWFGDRHRIRRREKELLTSPRHPTRIIPILLPSDLPLSPISPLPPSGKEKFPVRENSNSHYTNNNNINSSNNNKEALLQALRRVRKVLLEEGNEAVGYTEAEKKELLAFQTQWECFLRTVWEGEGRSPRGAAAVTSPNYSSEADSSSSQLSTIASDWYAMLQTDPLEKRDGKHFFDLFYDKLLIHCDNLPEQLLLLKKAKEEHNDENNSGNDNNVNYNQLGSWEEANSPSPLGTSPLLKAAEYYRDRPFGSVALDYFTLLHLAVSCYPDTKLGALPPPALNGRPPAALKDQNNMFTRRLHSVAVYWSGYGITATDYEALLDHLRQILPVLHPPSVWCRREGRWGKFLTATLSALREGVESDEGQKARRCFQEQRQSNIYNSLCKLQSLQQEALPPHGSFFQAVFASLAEVVPVYEPILRRFQHSDRSSDQKMWTMLQQLALLFSRPAAFLQACQEVAVLHHRLQVSADLVRGVLPQFLATAARVMDDHWDPVCKQQTNQFLSTLVLNIAEAMVVSAALPSMLDPPETLKATAPRRQRQFTTPDGSAPFCLMFTDIESSTNLWQRNSDIMKSAVEQHHRIIRNVIADYGGYEVKTAGDSFLIAAKDMLVGLKIAVAIQLELMRNLPIVPGFEMLDEVQGGGDPSAWSNQTLRVRIGMEHCTQATATYDTIHRRYDYYGPSVNQCARIEAAAAGGQILMSRESFKALKAIPEFHTEPCPPYLRDLSGATPMDDRGLDHFVAMGDMGRIKLKGNDKLVRLASMVPQCLAGRAFPVVGGEEGD